MENNAKSGNNWSGIILNNNLPSHIVKLGNISILFANIFLTAYFATCLLLASAKLNFTSATLLKFVSTGPGHKILICTFDFFLLSSSLIDSENLTT